MNAFELLLSKRWIVKDQDKDLYYKTKDKIGEVKKFFTEKLGYQLIVNPYVIKLEKIPAKPQIWMGIGEFTEVNHYVFFCLILMFLEDKEAGEQFILSELLEFIQMNYQYEEIDWTLYQYRRSLVRVMKTVADYGMLKVDDGSSEQFMSDYQQEVLYENVGTSRYFMRNFTQDIQEFQTLADFTKSEWIDMTSERGVVRRQRVYRKLLTTPGMYKEAEDDEDFVYLKNYRNTIEGDFQDYIDCKLDVHRTSAYLILGEECGMGKNLPAQSIRSDLILLCNAIIWQAAESGKLKLEADENIFMTETEFQLLIEECKKSYGEKFSKSYREMTTSHFVNMMKDELKNWGIAEYVSSETVKIRPIAGKVIGRYAKELV